MLRDQFKNKIVLITGHTGFKGSWLTQWMTLLGADVIGISESVPTSPSLFEALGLREKIAAHIICDIRNQGDVLKAISDYSPDYIFHMAAQPIVSTSYKNPIETFQTNLMGTVNILEAVRVLDIPVNIIVVTSDKCYLNTESYWGYKEIDPLGGKDPYSASKSMAEIAVASYYHSFFKDNDKINIGSVRAGNVIGGGDWSRDRIIPDAISAWSNKETMEIRNPQAIRPWQHVLDVLYGYMLFGMKLANNELVGEAINFGPTEGEDYSVQELVTQLFRYISSNLGSEHFKVVRNPIKETSRLRINSEKARRELGWRNYLQFSEAIKWTSEWYKQYYQKPDDMVAFTNNQIAEFEKKI